MRCLLQAWGWRGSDTILHSLPLHHTHGIINALYCAHAAGATVHFMGKFSPAAVWANIMVRGLALNLPCRLSLTHPHPPHVMHTA